TRANLVERPPHAEADARGIEQPGDGVGRRGESAARPQPWRADALDRDPGFVGRCPRQRPSFETDEVDVESLGAERMRVVPHAGAASEISECDDDGSHSGRIVTGWRSHSTRDLYGSKTVRGG